MEEKIKAIIEEMDNGDKIALWNESCYECSDCDDKIFDMQDFDELMSDNTPSEIANRIFFGGGFNPNHDYFALDGYANLASFDWADAENSPFDIDDLVDRIMQHENAFGCDEIAAVLNGEDDDEEDDEEDETEA